MRTLSLREPNRATLAWVIETVGPGSRIASVRPMSVGSTALHAIDILDAAGIRHHLALRRFVDADRLDGDPWYVPRNEATVLGLLEGSGVPAPLLVGHDLEPMDCDVPALLITRLAGHPPGAPRDMERFLRELALALTAIHGVDERARTELPAYAPYYGGDDLHVPAWSSHRRAWERAFEIVGSAPPQTPTGFIHRDYHAEQTLWSRGRLTGVVDWTTGCWGPRAIDLARVRLNLAGDFGSDVAARFLQIHRSLASEDLHHPYWDLVDAADCLPDMPYPPPTAEDALSHARFDDWVAQVVATVG